MRLLVDQNPKVPDRQAARAGKGEDPGPAMAAMAKGLEQAGADFLVMPCNMAHAFAQPMRTPFRYRSSQSSMSPSMLAASSRAIGVLTTPGCLNAGLYQEALAEAGLAAVLPDEGEVD